MFAPSGTTGRDFSFFFFLNISYYLIRSMEDV